MTLDEIQKQLEEQDHIIRDAIKKRDYLKRELELLCSFDNNKSVKALYGKHYKLIAGKTTHLFCIKGAHENPKFVSANELRFCDSVYGKTSLTYGKSEPPVKIFSDDGTFIGPHGGYNATPLTEISYEEFLNEAKKMFQLFSDKIK